MRRLYYERERPTTEIAQRFAREIEAELGSDPPRQLDPASMIDKVTWVARYVQGREIASLLCLAAEFLRKNATIDRDWYTALGFITMARAQPGVRDDIAWQEQADTLEQRIKKEFDDSGESSEPA